MGFLKKLFGGNSDEKNDEELEITEEVTVSMVEENTETDPDKKRLAEIKSQLNNYRSEYGDGDEEMILYKTNVEVGKWLVQDLYKKANYDGIGLFKDTSGLLQHWSFMLFKAIKLNNSTGYEEICRRLELADFLDLKNHNLGDEFMPKRELENSELYILWSWYCTNMKIEESSVVTMSGVIAARVRNEIMSQQLKAVELLAVEERELELKIERGV